MPINNKSIFIFFRVLLGVLLLLALTDLLLSQVPGSLSEYFESHVLAYTCFGIILILMFVRVNFFSYEDEYEIIHIRSKSLIFGSLQSEGQTRYEFPKGILYNVDFKEGWFSKTLTIYLKSSANVKKIRRFNLQFLPKAKIRYVVNSLKKVAERNRRSAESSL